MKRFKFPIRTTSEGSIDPYGGKPMPKLADIDEAGLLHARRTRRLTARGKPRRADPRVKLHQRPKPPRGWRICRGERQWLTGTFGNPEVVEEELDILLIGGGMACCGAAFEMMRWAEAAKAETGIELKIKLVDKAAMDRSGAVAQGLSAINTYIGPEQDPADYARMVSNDLMGITRDDLAYDLGRHVDESVHLFEEWGLPIWKTDADGVRHDGAESQRKACPR